MTDLIAVAGSEARRLVLPRPRGLIDAENISVAAPGSTQVILKAVSVRLEAGSVVGIIGPSAAGKSTLVRALTEIWPLLEGSVRVDVSDLRHWHWNISPGVVVAEGSRKVVQHLEGGIVHEVLVRDEQAVRAGDVLLRIDPVQSRASRLKRM